MTGLTPDITAATVVEHGILRVTFADGLTAELGVLERMRGPVFAQARTPEGFAKVAVDPETGTVVWPGGADLAPDTLYVRARTGTWPNQDLAAWQTLTDQGPQSAECRSRATTPRASQSRQSGAHHRANLRLTRPCFAGSQVRLQPAAPPNEPPPSIRRIRALRAFGQTDANWRGMSKAGFPRPSGSCSSERPTRVPRE